MAFENDPLAEVLHAAVAFAPAAEKLQLFGQFVGAWDLRWIGQNHEGKTIEVPGELHFGWILQGRAVQDVWRVPLDPADAPGMRGFYGTTIRFYDPSIDAWRSTWIDPFNGRVRRFIGRRDAAGIMLKSLDEGDTQERWSFRDIKADSFRWVGEVSTDGGRVWAQDEVMLATRRR
jgi:hypothetical protein